MRFKTGISPVMSIVLLVLVAVIGVVIVYMWALGFIQALAPTNQSRMLERITIELVCVRDNTIIVYVRNVGRTIAIIDTIYVTKYPELVEVPGTAGGVPTEVAPGDVVRVYYTVSALESGVYMVKVTTKNGVEAVSIVYKAP